MPSVHSVINGSLYAVYGNALYKLDDKFDALPLACT